MRVEILKIGAGAVIPIYRRAKEDQNNEAAHPRPLACQEPGGALARLHLKGSPGSGSWSTQLCTKGFRGHIQLAFSVAPWKRRKKIMGMKRQRDIRAMKRDIRAVRVRVMTTAMALVERRKCRYCPSTPREGPHSVLSGESSIRCCNTTVTQPHQCL